MLELDLATVLWQMFNFVVFAGALYWLLFRPAMASLRMRAREDARLRAALQAERDAAEALRVELDARLAGAEEEAEAIIERTKDEAEVERVTLMQEAQEEAERVLAEAQTNAQRLRRQAVEEFHAEFLDDVLEVCSMVIGQIAPQELQDTLVQQLFDSIWELGRGDMQRVDVLRRALGERTPTVVARSAKPLTPEQQGQLVRTFTALADRNINLDLKVDPALGLGMRVRMGDIVLDNTVSSKLDELGGSVTEALQEKVRQ